MLVLTLMFWCLNSNAPLLIWNCRLYLRPNTNLRSGGRKYANQSLLTVITYDLQLFKKLIKLFPTGIITAIALLPDHHLTFLWSHKSSDLSAVWHDMCMTSCVHMYPFSQRNRTTERTVRIGVLSDREVGEGWTQFEKGWLGNVGGGGEGGRVFIKKGVSTPLPTMHRDFKNFPSPKN